MAEEERAVGERGGVTERSYGRGDNDGMLRERKKRALSERRGAAWGAGRI